MIPPKNAIDGAAPSGRTFFASSCTDASAVVSHRTILQLYLPKGLNEVFPGDLQLHSAPLNFAVAKFLDRYCLLQRNMNLL